MSEAKKTPKAPVNWRNVGLNAKEFLLKIGLSSASMGLGVFGMTKLFEMIKGAPVSISPEAGLTGAVAGIVYGVIVWAETGTYHPIRQQPVK